MKASSMKEKGKKKSVILWPKKKRKKKTQELKRHACISQTLLFLEFSSLIVSQLHIETLIHNKRPCDFGSSFSSTPLSILSTFFLRTRESKMQRKKLEQKFKLLSLNQWKILCNYLDNNRRLEKSILCLSFSCHEKHNKSQNPSSLTAFWFPSFQR